MYTPINKNEKRVLRSLYALENATVYEIAKHTLINRTTLYPILEKLLEKGLVTKIKIEGNTYFQPISVKDFTLWAKRIKDALDKENQEFIDEIKNQSRREATTLLPEIKHFSGMEGVKNLYADTWRDNPEKIIYAITDYEKAYETLGDFLYKDYFPQRIKHGIRVKNILPDSAIGRRELKNKKSLLREMKLIDIFKDLNIEINIYGSKVAIIAYDKKNPSGVLIKNEKIAGALKNIFEHIWKHSK